eukprot:gene9627-7321_t
MPTVDPDTLDPEKEIRLKGEVNGRRNAGCVVVQACDPR